MLRICITYLYTIKYSGHFKRFQLIDILSQLTKLATFIDKLTAPTPQNFFNFYGPDDVKFIIARPDSVGRTLS